MRGILVLMGAAIFFVGLLTMAKAEGQLRPLKYEDPKCKKLRVQFFLGLFGMFLGPFFIMIS